MGHGAYQFSVLYNRRAGHALHDAAGGLQQLRVCDLQEHIPSGLVPIGIDLQNFHRILLNGFSVYRRADHRTASLHLIPGGNSQCIPRPLFFRYAKNSLMGIFRKGAGHSILHSANQLSRCAHRTLLNTRHRCLIGIAPAHCQQLTCRGIDPMSQSPKLTGLRIIPCHRTYTGDPLPKIHTQPRSVCGDFGANRQTFVCAGPLHRQFHHSVRPLQRMAHILRAPDRLVIHRYDLIPHLQTSLPGCCPRGIVKGRHRYAAVCQFNADDLSHRDQRPCGRYADS